MKTVQLNRTENKDWTYISGYQKLNKPLVLVFSNRFLLNDKNIYNEIRALFPDGEIVFASTSGNIVHRDVKEQSITITAIEFEKSEFKIKTLNNISQESDSYKVGFDFADQFNKHQLKSIFLLCYNRQPNVSAFISGMSDAVGNNVVITGGVCGDDERFEITLSSYNQLPQQNQVIAIGFYGETLEVTPSVEGGWTAFGPERVVTKAKDRVLYELDGKPALDLYNKYLGSDDDRLGVEFFPFSVRTEKDENAFVRAISYVNEKNNSIELAGDIPENSRIQFLLSNTDSIANASEIAATNAINKRENKPELAILVSCFGRKLVLDQRLEEEVEGVQDALGDDVTVTGFYSYGELSPFNNGENACKLHNQTMTLTLISE